MNARGHGRHSEYLSADYGHLFAIVAITRKYVNSEVAELSRQRGLTHELHAWRSGLPIRYESV